MHDEHVSRLGVGRRQFIGAAVGTLGGLSVFGTGTTGATRTGTYAIAQGGHSAAVTPLSGDDPIEAFYDWRRAATDYSSFGTTALQRPNTSIAFLYEEPSGGISLVLIHGKYSDSGSGGDGGSVTFEFAGLPSAGAWRVQDDFYEASSNYDQWDTSGTDQQVDWTWGPNRTDGGAYGPLGGGFAIQIDPRFNDDAALAGEYYDGSVSSWQFLSGSLSRPDRYELDRSEPLEIRTLDREAERDTPSAEEIEERAEERVEEIRERVRERIEEARERAAGRGNGRGPPDDDDVPGRGPPDDDDVPGRGPPDEDEIRERVRERIAEIREEAREEEDEDEDDD